MSEANQLLAKLIEPFAIEDVKQRRQGSVMLDYISVDATIRRLNEVLGASWSTSDLSTSLIPLDGGTSGGKFIATVALTLTALGKQAVGVGADVATDPDKAVKTALAEALKKAGHQFGIGLYLWQEEERAIVARQRAGTTIPVNRGKVTEPVQQGGEYTTGSEFPSDGGF